MKAPKAYASAVALTLVPPNLPKLLSAFGRPCSDISEISGPTWAKVKPSEADIMEQAVWPFYRPKPGLAPMLLGRVIGRGGFPF